MHIKSYAIKLPIWLMLQKRKHISRKLKKEGQTQEPFGSCLKSFEYIVRKMAVKKNFGISYDNNTTKNESDLAELFNNYFIYVASKLKEPITDSEFERLNFMQSNIPSDIEFKIPLTNTGFVRKFLSSVNVSKSTGLDNIGPRILKISANIIAPSLVYIVNKSIISGSFPSMWKEAKVKPLFKLGDKDDINKYRPISIFPTISKLH